MKDAGVARCREAPTGGRWFRDCLSRVKFSCSGSGPHPELRGYVNAATNQVTSREGGTALAPEKSINYSVGFELAPTVFLRGLDVQATWYSVKVNNTLLAFTATSSNDLADPLQRFHFIVPSDLGCPVAANAIQAPAHETFLVTISSNPIRAASSGSLCLRTGNRAPLAGDRAENSRRPVSLFAREISLIQCLLFGRALLADEPRLPFAQIIVGQTRSTMVQVGVGLLTLHFDPIWTNA